MLIAAAVAAVISMVVVPPDEVYLTYFDWRTIACLFCVLAVANAFRRIGAFDRVARQTLAKSHNSRIIVCIIVTITAVFSMLFTNDVALIIMLPMSAILLVELKQPNLVAGTFAFQAIAANLCGMITPFGSPQNLYLYSYYQIGLWDFLLTMFVPFLLSVAGIAAGVAIMMRKSDVTKGVIEEEDQRSPNSKPEMPLDSRRLRLYIVLFIVALLAVFRILPFAVAVIIVAVGVFAFDRKALVEVDYALLLTFVCFFIFSGNMARVPVLEETLAPLMADWGLVVSACLSQVISNVPAAVVLSHFVTAWQPLLLGVNIGGAGTFVGSLASLIAIRCYMLSRKLFTPLREPKAPTMGRFLLVFGALNIAFFLGLLGACCLIFGTA